MTFAAAHENHMMSRSASASCANAAFSCANLVILDAILLASIIICRGGSVILGVGLVLAGLLAGGKLNDASWARGSW